MRGQKWLIALVVGVPLAVVLNAPAHAGPVKGHTTPPSTARLRSR